MTKFFGGDLLQGDWVRIVEHLLDQTQASAFNTGNHGELEGLAEDGEKSVHIDRNHLRNPAHFSALLLGPWWRHLTCPDTNPVTCALEQTSNLPYLVQGRFPSLVPQVRVGTVP